MNDLTANNQKKKSLDILKSLYDKDSFVELFQNVLEDNIYLGYGTIWGKNVYSFIQNSSSKSGALDKNAFFRISKVYDLALKTGAPIVGIYDSKGVDLNEGLDSIDYLSKWLSYSNNLSGVIPQISIILGDCISSQSMIASCSDFIIMNKNANFYLNSPFVSGSDYSSNDAVKEGLVHLEGNDENECIELAKKLVGYLPSNNLAIPFHFMFDKKENKKVTSNLYGLSLLNAISDDDSIIEIQKGYDNSILTCFTTIKGVVIAFILTNKEKITKNGSLKAARFIRFCDSFSIPIVTVYGGEEFLQDTPLSSLKAISSLSHAYLESTCSKLSIITNDSYGLGLLVFGAHGNCNDLVLCYDNVKISNLSTSAYNEIFKDDKEKLNLKSGKNCFDINLALNSGDVDNTINPKDLRDNIDSYLYLLNDKNVSRLSKKHGNIIF